MNRREFIAIAGAALAAPALPAELKPGDTFTMAGTMVENPPTRDFKPEHILAGDFLRIEHADGSFSNHVATSNVQQSWFIDMQVEIYPVIWMPVPGSRFGHPTRDVLLSDAIKARDAYAAEMRRLGVTPADLARAMYPENW